MVEAAIRTTEVDQPTSHKDSKYLTFALGGDQCGLGIPKVQEIIGCMDITSIRQTPDYVTPGQRWGS